MTRNLDCHVENHARWQRLHAASPQALAELSCQHGIALPASIARPGDMVRIRCVYPQHNTLHVCDLLWRLEADTLLTIEIGHNTRHHLLHPAQAGQYLHTQQLPSNSTQALALALLHQLLTHANQALTRIGTVLSESSAEIDAFQRSIGTQHARGAQDMMDVDTRLSRLHDPASMLMQALADLEHAARQLRRTACPRHTRLPDQHIDELLAAIAGTMHRAKFTLERQRFHWRAAGEAVAMSDLNVTKVFTVLWATFIPGTALVNWYGQNFHVMPELSWEGSLWTQLLAVLILTAIPLWMVKQSGTLR